MQRVKRKNPWLTLVLLVITGLVYSALSLALSGQGEISWGGDPVLFLWNTLPVLLMLGLVWLATGFAWLASLLTGGAVFLLTGGNYFKTAFRGDPLIWQDLHNLREGAQMAGEYEVAFTPLMYGFLAAIFLLSALLFAFGRGRPGSVVRLLSLTAVGLVSLYCFYEVYPDDQRYTALAGEYARSDGDAYAACGMLYPFFHSYGEYAEIFGRYDASGAQEILARYEDGEIPQEKKVSLVTIQLEAFADLSLYNIDGLRPHVYQKFHEMLEESYSGRLITDVFAGGTTETEWAVLTGGNYHGDFTEKTNSVAWYLKSQGYVTGGGHPSHEWFYDRVTVNPNLGLDDYLFMENYYGQFPKADKDVAYDNVFFPDLENRIQSHFATSEQPMFSFNVTYQGHGPYNMERAYWGTGYCTGDYEEGTINALNNYFHVIWDTSNYVTHLLRYLEKLEEPVVLLLYGDHKPWMGNKGAIYEGLGISLDTSTEEGFLNHYATWYAIWGNPAAKAALGEDFQGTGPDLSPCFLMNEVFRLCGWEGSAYMQAQRQTAETLPVLHTKGWVKEEGSYTLAPSDEAEALAEQFQMISRYDRTHWSGALPADEK